MSKFLRRRIEATIGHMIAPLDEMNGDPDLEPEPAEEQHDREAPLTFVVAEMTRRLSTSRR
jgi:hypothetical protein